MRNLPANQQHFESDEDEECQALYIYTKLQRYNLSIMILKDGLNRLPA